MSVTRYGVQMAGGVPVVTAPAEIDMTTAGQLRAILLQWHTRGHVTVVVDMTGTQFCDSAGLRELVRAHQRAVAEGGELRLVLPADGAVPRVFTVTGLDRLIPHFAALEQALAQVPANGGRSRSSGPRLGSQVRERGAVADGRACERCGVAFVPQREHARFCSGDCRAAWNREHMGDPAVEASALQWSVTAMSEAAGRLAGVRVSGSRTAASPRFTTANAAATNAGTWNPHWLRRPPVAGPITNPRPNATPSSPRPRARPLASVTSVI